MLNVNNILKRYESAKSRTQTWQNNLQDCYTLVMPNRANFNRVEQSKGASKTLKVYDPNATLALDKASQTLQLTAFGYRQWNQIKPTKKFLNGKVKRQPGEKSLPTVEELKDKCAEYTDLFFDLFNNSNFALAAHQCIMEMFISTGVMLVNPGTPDMPFSFTSVPLHEVSLGAGPNQSIRDVYREYKVPVSVIKQTWPKANINQKLQDMINSDPTQEIEIIEGTEYHPGKHDKDYVYFVMEKDGDGVILEEPRMVSPWIVFRPKVLSGELFGRGPLYDLLPTLKTINKSMEFIIQAGGYNARPIVMSKIAQFTNTNTARLASGSIISVKPSTQGDALTQLKLEASGAEMQQLRQELLNALNDAMNINPIGDPVTGDPRQTATYTNIQNQNRIERNQSMLSRIEYEFVRPLINVCWHYMYQFGLVTERLDDIIFAQYDSPIIQLAGQKEVQKLVSTVEMLEQIITDPSKQPFVSTYEFDLEKTTSFVSNRLGVSYDVLRSDESKQQLLQQAQQQQQAQMQAQQQQAQGQQQPEQPMVAPQQPMQFQGVPDQ